MLLQEMKNAINFKHQPLSDTLEATTPERPVTGKDLYGRHVGFRIEDHGLFVAGIVHDLAPDANIECIRVLNDFGVGNVNTLLHALYDIQKRMSESNPETHEVGGLHNKPIVINMSLVV